VLWEVVRDAVKEAGNLSEKIGRSLTDSTFANTLSPGLLLVSEGGLQPPSVGCNPVHLIVYKVQPPVGVVSVA
jgi:hypothetical protein